MTITKILCSGRVLGCLAILSLAAASSAYAGIGSAESPAFSFNALGCVPTPGVRMAAAESSPAFMSRVPADSTLDCVVNVLDLIYVRNALGKDVESGENWRSDINNDGKVNVLDLIAVRNSLGQRCKR